MARSREPSTGSSEGFPPGRLAGTRLVPAELEQAFRQSRLRGDGRDAAVVVGSLTLLLIPFVFNDLVWVASAEKMVVVSAARLVYFLSGMLVAFLGLRARRVAALDAAILVNALCAAAFTVVVQSTRPADFYLPAILNAVGALLYWGVVPNRFSFQALGAAALTGACVAWIALFREPPAAPVALLLALSLLTANAAGGFVSWRLHRSGRIQFLAEREREVSTRRLAESEELFRTAFENASIGWALTDPSGRFLRVNPALCRFLGYGQDELRGRTVGEVSHPDDRALSRGMIEDYLAGRPVPTTEKRYVRKDGVTVWGEVTASLVRELDGSPRHFVTAVVDVNERRLTQDALAASRSRYDELYDGLGDGVVGVAMDGTVLEFNEAYRRMVGYTADELRAMTFQQLTPERWREEEARRLEELVRTGAAVATYEKEYRRKDGTVFPIELRVFVRREGGKPIGMWGVVRDITREKALRTQFDVASRLATMGTLVAGMAHEINNPLGGAIASHGFAAEEVARVRKLLRSGEPVDREDAARRLEEVEEALADAQVGEQRIAAIVKDLTLLGRPDSRRSPVSLARVVAEAVGWVPAALRARADFEVADGGAPEVAASEGQLVQILVNLLTNAARAAPEGRKVRVRVALGPGAPGSGRIEVTDDGVGMTPEVQAHMFDPFFSTRGVGQGMGLGLAICHAIVTAHGGTISASSVQGQGTTLRVDLPVA